MTAVAQDVDPRGVHGTKVKSITANDMLVRGKLERAPEALARLSSQSVESVLLPMDGRTRFVLDEGWFVNLDGKADSAPLDAWVVVKGTDGSEDAALQLSKAALLELTSSVGMPKTYVTKTPARLVVPHLDYWYESPERGSRLLMVDGVAHGVTKATFQSFSNSEIAERALDRICQRYSIQPDDVLVDKAKSRSTLQSTSLLFVVPEATRAMRPGDDWSGGVQVMNSLTGEHATRARSYLFRWWCTNGATTSGKASATFDRRDRDGDVYDWVGRSVDQALAHLEDEFDRVQKMTTEPIEGEVRVAIDNLAARYKLSNPVREAIRNQMMETPDVTMYGLMQAVTAAANQRGISTAVAERLMDIGGDFVYGAGRCDSCHSVLVEDHDH